MLITLFVILLLLAGTSVAVTCNLTRKTAGPQGGSTFYTDFYCLVLQPFSAVFTITTLDLQG